MGTNQTITVAQAKRSFFDLISRARDRMEKFILTSNGKPEAILMSYEEYEDLIEDMELLSNPDKVREIKEISEAMDRGEYATYEEVFGHPPPKK